MARTYGTISSLAIVGIVALAFSAAPVGLDYDFTPETKSAFAKGKGSGNSGGKGGSKRSSKSASKGKSGGDGGTGLDQADEGDSHGKSGNGHLKAKGNGHQKHHDGDAEHADHDGHEKLRGNLNAAHASDTARENASENSMVGLLAAYAKAVEEGDPDYDTEEEQQQRLGEISNKSYYDEDASADIVDAEVVQKVNELLGVDNLPAAEDPAEE